jgi:cold shock CspA family protein
MAAPLVGVVKFYDPRPAKEYGFITVGDTDHYFSTRALQLSGLRHSNTGDVVSFTLVPEPRGGKRMRAADIKLLPAD